ncbi:MAG: hypothetical protein WBC04_21845 [Candidatus Acidiferrales bacterium]
MDFDAIWTWIIALTPAALYVWLYFSYLQVIRDKRDELKRLLVRGGAMQQYASAYGNLGDDAEQIASRVLIRNNYAALSYLRALVFTAFITTIATAVAIAKAGLPISLPSRLVQFINTAPAIPAMLAGCAGAFVWGLYELLRRYRIGDLTPSVIYFTGIRLMVLAGVGPALSTVLKTEFSWAIAFGLGVMPLNTIAQVAAEPTRRALKLPAPSSPVPDALLAFIQGLSPEMIDRLGEAGIYNVQQLAFTDPLRLLVRTNLDWKVILDLVDQAFLAVYVGPKIVELRSMGIRGAVELCGVRDQANKSQLTASIAAILGRSADDVQSLIDTVCLDPTRGFIAELWS